MRIVGELSARVGTLLRWFDKQMRVALGRETTLLSRIVAFVALLSVLMIVGFGIKVVLSRGPERLVIATAGEGGEYLAFGRALKELLDEQKLGIDLRVDSTNGSYDNMRRLESGEADLAIAQNDTPAQPSVRAIASLFPETLHLIVAEDARIHEVRDLQGKEIAVMRNLLDPGDPGSQSERFFAGFIQHYGLNRDDVKATHCDLAGGAEKLIKRDVDAIILFIAAGNRSIGDLLKQKERPVKLLPIDVHALESWHPYVEETTIHRGAYCGNPVIPAQDVPSASVQALLLTHKGVDKRAIYRVASILYEYRNTLIRKRPQSVDISFPTSGQDLGIPVHPGARVWYNQDKPGFLLVYAEPLALLLSVFVLCGSGIWQLRSHLRKSRKHRAAMYRTEIMDQVQRLRTAGSPGDLEDVREKLFDVFSRILDDLDKDRISADVLPLFTFPGEVAISALRHREMVLLNLLPGPHGADDDLSKKHAD